MPDIILSVLGPYSQVYSGTVCHPLVTIPHLPSTRTLLATHSCATDPLLSTHGPSRVPDVS